MQQAFSSVKACSKVKVWTEAAEVFAGGVKAVQEHAGRMAVYEKMVNEDLNTMGVLLGVEDIDPFLQVPIGYREKVFNRCNRFVLRKYEEPEPSEE